MKILFTGIVQNTTIFLYIALSWFWDLLFFFQLDPSLIPFHFLHNSNLNRILAILDLGGREADIFIIHINLVSIIAVVV